MRDYRGVEREIRVTNRGRFQVLPVPPNSHDMSTAPVFGTREEAEAYIRRPMPKSEVAEAEQEAERLQYRAAYAAILADPSLRDMRRDIQEQYARAASQSKLAGDHQRAAVMAGGQYSATGRDISAVRQSYADEVADGAAEEWEHHRKLSLEYERALQQRMTASGIPVELFRSPVVIDNAIASATRAWFERFPELRHAD